MMTQSELNTLLSANPLEVEAFFGEVTVEASDAYIFFDAISDRPVAGDNTAQTYISGIQMQVYAKDKDTETALTSYIKGLFPVSVYYSRDGEFFVSTSTTERFVRWGV